MTRRAPDENPKLVSAEERDLLRRLEEALSDDELRRVLTCAMLVLDDDARTRLLARVDAETAAALGPVLVPPRRGARPLSPTAPVAGKGKLRQEWGRLWQQWAAVIAESGEEEGKYVQQERHWEAPYVDTTSISSDLDAIATKMKPLIPRVLAEEIAPQFSFAKALDDMDDELYADLPDWIEPGGGETCCLGPEATSCLLQWEWNVAKRKGRDAPAFVDDLRDLEERLENLGLDHPTLGAFVLGLSDEDLRGILASMTRQRSSARWSDAFRHAHGCWAQILRALSKRWNPALFAQTSRANIAQDWTLALPLVQAAVKRKAFAEAGTLVDEALRARLRLDKGDRWEPREQLLAHRDRMYYGDDADKKLAALLRLWQQTAEAQGQPDLVAALAIQITALRDAENGDVMLEAFRAVPPEFQKVRDALFVDWRTLFVQRTLQTERGGVRIACSDWVGALVDGAWAGSEGATVFHAAVRAALEEAGAPSAAKPRPAWGNPRDSFDHRATPLFALSILTRDLDATAPTLKKSAPTLFKLLRVGDSGERDRLAKTRQTWCARLGGPTLLADVVAFWRDHATRFVPDPGDTMANYAQSADWLAAVQEMNPTAAKELLARWATVYHLKRNLWRDVAERGIALPDGVRVAPGTSPSRKGLGSR